MTTDKYSNDEALVKAIRREEDEAFRILYQRYYPMIQHLILKNSGQQEDAKDIFQELVIQLFINLRKAEFQLESKLSTYLYSIARNKWREKLRKKKHTEPFTFVDTGSAYIEVDEIEIKVLNEQRYAQIEELFKHITENCRKILRLYYFSRLSLDEIAQKMNYTYQFAKKKKSRCLKGLRKMLNSQ